MSSSYSSSIPNLLAELDGFKVAVDAKAQRADIILDRPPLNVVSMHQRDQMSAVFAELCRDERVRVIVLRADGKNFSSGGDINGFLASSPERVSHLAETVMAPERCSKPVIAQIRGYCFGVGFEWSLACDFRIVSDTAQMALPEQRIGMIPGSGGSIRLLHMIGIARTKDMVMRSRRISGQEALDWGIAQSCVADDKLEETVNALVEELKGFSPLAQRTAKNLLNQAQDMSVHGGIALEGDAYGRLRSSDDFKEGVASFYEKRKANFTGS